ncbi:hypothetical protein MASR2M29_07910 [Spirochaetota bacterium]
MVVSLFALLVSCLYAQDVTSVEPTTEKTVIAQPVFTESQVAGALLVSSAAQLGTVIQSLWYGESWYPWAFAGTMTLQNLPGLLSGATNAVPDMIAQLSLDGLFAANQLFFGENMLMPLLFNSAHKFSMFFTYDTYTDMRSRSGKLDYSNITRYGFFDLASAPFDLATYKDWYVWGYLGSIALYSAISLCTMDQSSAVWTTGESYIGSNRLPAVWGAALVLLLQVPNFVMTGIGEEALYRGVYYEELSYRMGEWPAKVLDGLYFSLSHFPQKIKSIQAMPAQDIALSLLVTTLHAFWYQYIYEWGGLRAAVTAHAVTDIMLFFTDWLLQGGVPNESGFSINTKLLSITLRL